MEGPPNRVLVDYDNLRCNVAHAYPKHIISMTMVNAKGDMERRIDQDEWNKKRGHRDNAIDDNNFIIVERTVLRRKH